MECYLLINYKAPLLNNLYEDNVLGPLMVINHILLWAHKRKIQQSYEANNTICMLGPSMDYLVITQYSLPLVGRRLLN